MSTAIRPEHCTCPEVDPDGQHVADCDLSSACEIVDVRWTPNNHGYPYRAFCACGWQSAGYVRQHAAVAMGAAHVTGEA